MANDNPIDRAKILNATAASLRKHAQVLLRESRRLRKVAREIRHGSRRQREKK